MDTAEKVAWLKTVLREDSIPYFTDEELEFYLGENGGDHKLSAYRLLLIKSEDTTLSVSGLTASDSSSYFKRLARLYKPNNSGILKGD